MNSDLDHRGPLKRIHSRREIDGVVGPYAESEGPDPTRTSQLAESIEGKGRRCLGALSGPLWGLKARDQGLKPPQLARAAAIA